MVRFSVSAMAVVSPNHWTNRKPLFGTATSWAPDPGASQATPLRSSETELVTLPDTSDVARKRYSVFNSAVKVSGVASMFTVCVRAPASLQDCQRYRVNVSPWIESTEMVWTLGYAQMMAWGAAS